MLLGFWPTLYLVGLVVSAAMVWRRGADMRRIAALMVLECGLSNAVVWLTGEHAPVLCFAGIFTLIGIAVLWPPAGKTAKWVGYGYIGRLVAAWGAFIAQAYFLTTGKTVEGRYLDIDAGVAWLQLAALLIGAGYGSGIRHLFGLHRGNRIAPSYGRARDRKVP